jgi:hypothetical protein
MPSAKPEALAKTKLAAFGLAGGLGAWFLTWSLRRVLTPQGKPPCAVILCFNVLGERAGCRDECFAEILRTTASPGYVKLKNMRGD